MLPTLNPKLPILVHRASLFSVHSRVQLCETKKKKKRENVATNDPDSNCVCSA